MRKEIDPISKIKFGHGRTRTNADILCFIMGNATSVLSAAVRDRLRRQFLRWLLSTVACIFGGGVVHAAPMYPSVLAEMRARGDTCGVSCPSGVGNLWAKFSARQASASAPGSFGAPTFFAGPNKTPVTRGTVRIAVIPVQFVQDSSTTTTGTGQFFADKHGDSPAVGDSIELMVNRVDTYYRGVSYGLLTFSYTVFDSYMPTVSKTMDSYTSSQDNIKSLIVETLRRVDTFVNIGAYDAVVILTAGTGKQLTGASRDNSAQFIGLTGSDSLYADTAASDSVSMAVIMNAFGRVQSNGETVTMMGTLCHELGHALGLPDLYNTASGSGGIGDWGLMGTGNYHGRPQGDSPAWMDPWCREYLGWAETRVISADTSLTLTKAESDSRIYKIRVYTNSDTEYFLFECREPSATGLDSSPGFGLLIWHIDSPLGLRASNTVNDLTSAHPKRGVDLVEANGSDIGSSGDPFSGTVGHPWPGSSAATGFGDNSSPSSRGYNDTIARFAIKDIALGSSVSFSVSFTDVTVSVTTTTKFPSSCLIGRALSPWPRAAAFARSVRDNLLKSKLGRTLVPLLTRI